LPPVQPLLLTITQRKMDLVTFQQACGVPNVVEGNGAILSRLTHTERRTLLRSLRRDMKSKKESLTPPPTVFPGFDLLSIAKITNPNHPCRNGFGLYATADIAKGTALGIYAGVVRTDKYAEETLVGNGMLFGLGSALQHAVVDGAECGNRMRYINDMSGIPGALKPNVTWEVQGTVTPRFEVQIVASAAEDISAGEELLTDYGDKYHWDKVSNTNEDPAEEEEGSMAAAQLLHPVLHDDNMVALKALDLAKTTMTKMVALFDRLGETETKDAQYAAQLLLVKTQHKAEMEELRLYVTQHVRDAQAKVNLANIRVEQIARQNEALKMLCRRNRKEEEEEEEGEPPRKKQKT
jgi:hypothetical protein